MALRHVRVEAGTDVTTTPDTFTVGVFKDAEWAARGLDALVRNGFTQDRLSLLARESPEATALAARLGAPGDDMEVPGVGRCVAIGPLVAVLDSSGGLRRKGLADAMRLAGFQPHDGRIFATLTERGGILVAVKSESRAADALATLHAYGGGNAAIGAWHGRV
jgi:hypothetical protein